MKTFLVFNVVQISSQKEIRLVKVKAEEEMAAKIEASMVLGREGLQVIDCCLACEVKEKEEIVEYFKFYTSYKIQDVR